MKKILIAVDNGPASEKVASVSFELGKQLNAEMALVSVVDTAELITAAGLTPEEMAEMVKNDFRKSQKILIDNIFKDHKISTFLEDGKPFEMILKAAENWNADLIALGTHGRIGLSHMLMGSVAEKVMRHSSKPLFVIPTK